MLDKEEGTSRLCVRYSGLVLERGGRVLGQDVGCRSRLCVGKGGRPCVGHDWDDAGRVLGKEVGNRLR